MNLNLQIIQSDLENLCLRSHINTPSEMRELQYVTLYQDDKKTKPEILYICPAHKINNFISKSAGCSFILIGEPEHKLAQTLNYLIIKADTKPIDLLEKVQEIFHRYMEWELCLQAAVIKEQGLKALAVISLNIFHNPMQFYNQKTLNCIFSVYDSTSYTLPEAFPEVDENGYMHPDLLLDLKIENILSTVAEKPMLITREHLALPAIMQDVIINGSTVGRIILFQVHKRLDERDMSLMTVFVNIIRQALIHNPKLYDIHSQFIDTTLSGLLTGKPIKDAAIFSLLQIWDWNVQDAYFCLAAKLPLNDKDTSSLTTLALTISRTIQCNCYLIHDDAIIFIINLTSAKTTRDVHLKLLLPVLRDNLLKAGISTIFHDFRKLRQYYIQALAGLQTGMRLNPSSWYFRFENYSLPYLANQLLKDMEPETLYPESLHSLIALDRQKNQQYIYILKTWLSCNMNISETARKLYMHRNTLLYKLEKIKEIMGNTLENYESRIFLMLILKIREFTQKEQ